MGNLPSTMPNPNYTEVDNLHVSGNVSGNGFNIFAKQTDLENKVDKVEGKSLTSNDFSNDDKTKLSNALGKSFANSVVTALWMTIDENQKNSISVSFSWVSPSDGTSQNETALIPIASEIQGGLMPYESFKEVLQLRLDMDAIGGVPTYLNGKNFETGDLEDLQELLTAEAINQGYESPLPNSLIINNWFNGHEYIYNSVTLEWIDYGVTSASMATNTSAGLIIGSALDGKGFVEADGTISIVGWDAVKSRILILETELLGIEPIVQDLENL